MSTPGGNRDRHEENAKEPMNIRALRTHVDPAGNMTLKNVMCDLFSSIKSSAVLLT